MEIVDELMVNSAKIKSRTLWTTKLYDSRYDRINEIK